MGAPSPQEGTTSNRYAILGRIATGGMAEIFLARAVGLAGVERHVVLKRVLPERARDPVFVKMFLDEARLAAQLQHPNIAQVHDIGRLGDSYFFTMEYVHGEDLRAILQRLAALRRLPPVQHALLVAAGAAAALHHAHDRTGPDRAPLGIVHRDVSPSNVMVSFEGAVKLVDFGVAKATQRSTETRTGTVKGKIAYMSPEQCQGAGVDRRSDVFSLGVVLYELLTLTRLFRRDTDFATMTAIVNEDAPPPSATRPELTPEVDRLVATALARDPDRRFPTAGAMLEAIEVAAESAGKTMSAHGLGRFLRELFGERPEPWIELEVRDDAPSLVTVTSQSIVRVDALAVAPALTPQPAPPPRPHAEDVEHELARTVPLRRREPDESGSGSSLPQVAPLGAEGAPTTRWTGPVAPVGAHPSPRTIVSGGAPPPAIAPPLAPPAVLPHARAPLASTPPPFVAPLSHLPTTYPTVTGKRVVTDLANQPLPDPGRRRLVILAIAATVVAVAIGVWALVRSGAPARRAAPVGATRALAAAPVDAAPSPRAPASVDAAVVPAVPVAAIDAPVAPTPALAVDAAPPAPSPAPAGAEVDAAGLAAVSAGAGVGDWTAVRKACGSIARAALTIDARAACAQAACIKKHRGEAQDYLRGVPRARRAAVAKVCAARGVDLDGSAPDPCEKNPLSCQH